MKFSPLVAVVLGFILSSPAHAALYLEYQNGEWMYADTGVYASGHDKMTEFLIRESILTIFRHEDRSQWTGDYKRFKEQIQRMRDDMKDQGMTEADLAALSKNMPEGSREVHKVANRVVANESVPCYEFGKHRELVLCFWKKGYELMKAAAGADIYKRIKNLDMENMGIPKNFTEQAVDDKQRNAIVVYEVNYFDAMGIHPFAINAMGAQAAKVVDDAKQQAKESGGPEPKRLLKSFSKKKRPINKHNDYKRYESVQAFFESGMGGGASAGGDMDTGSMPTGGDLNLKEIMEQYGGAGTQGGTTTKKKDKEVEKEKKKKGSWLKRAKEKAKGILNQ